MKIQLQGISKHSVGQYKFYKFIYLNLKNLATPITSIIKNVILITH